MTLNELEVTKLKHMWTRAIVYFKNCHKPFFESEDKKLEQKKVGSKLQSNFFSNFTSCFVCSCIAHNMWAANDDSQASLFKSTFLWSVKNSRSFFLIRQKFVSTTTHLQLGKAIMLSAALVGRFGHLVTCNLLL